MKTKTIIIAVGAIVLLASVGGFILKNKQNNYVQEDSKVVANNHVKNEEMAVASTTMSDKSVVQEKMPVKEVAKITSPWLSFTSEMKEMKLKTLTSTQYKVTQEGATENPHTNLYDQNFEKGIYVDIVSGEPLYLSTDKFDSGTGWPSFVKPISSNAVTLKTDNYLVVKRTEVLSKIAGSHLGHMFDDGPVERGGKRYCMNSAALRFVPISKMEAEGYGQFISKLN